MKGSLCSMMDIENNYTPDRHHSNCMKWDGIEHHFGRSDLLPLWVADMDFKAPDEVIEALGRMVKFGVFGYYQVPDSYYESILRWEKDHHGYGVSKEWIYFTPGIIPAIHAFVHIKTKPDDACMIFAPCYRPFIEAAVNTGRKIIAHELIEKANGQYVIDYKRLEKDIAINGVKILILGSPHNPTGRVWGADELEKIIEICRRYKVFIISDEVHQDIILDKDKRHIPTASMVDYDDMLVTLISASKTFNLAGCQNACAIIPNVELRAQYEAHMKDTRFIRGAMFGYAATEAAFTHGDEWLKTVLKVIRNNFEYARERFLKELPKVRISPTEGTYLMWADFGAYVPFVEMKNVFEEYCRVAVYYGNWFWPDTQHPDTHVRINLATKIENVIDAVDRIIFGIKRYLQEKQ